jgi:hypothetical protein
MHAESIRTHKNLSLSLTHTHTHKFPPYKTEPEHGTCRRAAHSPKGRIHHFALLVKYISEESNNIQAVLIYNLILVHFLMAS